MKARQWSLAVVLILINYLIFATLFTQLLETDFSLNYATRTPIPTFTPAPAQPIIIVPTLTPAPSVPTPTATRVLPSSDPNSEGDPLSDGNSQAGSSASSTNEPSLVAPGAVNIRSGPGINYSVIGTLNAGIIMPIVGRNADASWWQIRITNNTIGWVSNAVVSASNTNGVPVVEVPPAPAPTPVPAQPAASNPSPPQKPAYQFEPTGWWDDGNQGLTRFYGSIVDANNNPVDGVFVRATCGDYATISYPSGPVGWGPLNESFDWPPGFYDITVDTKPVPCIWILSVVDTDDRKTVKAMLSEAVPVEVTNEKSIIIAGWRKNW